MATIRQQLLDQLQKFIDPYLEQSWVEANAIKNIHEENGKYVIEIETGYPCKGKTAEWTALLTPQLESIEGVNEVRFIFSTKIQAQQTPQQNVMANVKNIIAVASGKGGVGKSTTAVNLALALQKEGATVGLLDADIYGPSIPIMLGAADQRPDSTDNKSIEPVVRFGLQTMSIGYLVAPEQAVVWRGPMASGALQQLINDTRWRDVDYLVVDLPPGTGDIQLTISQKVPVTGAVIVTTPQDVALADARKGIGMFEKVSIPVLGVVENMSMHICSNCGQQEAIFGTGGGEKLSLETGVELLAQLPLDLKIREQSDSGIPIMEFDENCAIADTYRELARKTAVAIINCSAANEQISISITDD